MGVFLLFCPRGLRCHIIGTQVQVSLVPEALYLLLLLLWLRLLMLLLHVGLWLLVRWPTRVLHGLQPATCSHVARHHRLLAKTKCAPVGSCVCIPPFVGRALGFALGVAEGAGHLQDSQRELQHAVCGAGRWDKSWGLAAQLNPSLLAALLLHSTRQSHTDAYP